MLLDHQVLPEFGDWTLASIDTLAVREWRADLLADGLSPKRAGKALQVLSQILASAVEGGRLARNAATGVRPPKVQRKEMHFLDAEQVEWLAAVAELRYRPLSCLPPIRPASLRVGRAPGRSAGSASLHGSGGRGGGGGQSPGVGPVKTHEARVAADATVGCRGGRTPSLAARPHSPEALVFTAPLGGPLQSGRFRPGTTSSQLSLPRTRQSPSCRRTGARPRCRTGLRFYDLRHTCASTAHRPGREHQGGAGAAGAMRPPASHSTPTGTCSRPRWRRSLTAWRMVRDAALAKRARTQHGPADNRLGEPAGG